MKKVLVVFVVLLVAGMFLTGCSSWKPLKQSDVSFADEMVENVLLAHNEGNYEKWAKDMGEEMLKDMPKEKFVELYEKAVGSKIGKYIPGSKTFLAAAVDKNGIIIVQYMAKFEKDDPVKLTFTFKEENGQKKIVGEFYDSQKLRGK